MSSKFGVDIGEGKRGRSSKKIHGIFWKRYFPEVLFTLE